MKMIPLSKGVKLHSQKLLNITFVLITTGCIFRVLSQPASFHINNQFYPLMGISGFIEYAAILLFGINIWKTLHSEQEEVVEHIEKATANTNVYQIIKQYPETLDILLRFGFKQLRNPILRNTLTRTINLGQAVQINPVDLDDLLKELNEVMKANSKQ